MPITVLGGTKVADTGFSVANSCRFNTGDEPYMHKTLVTPTSTKIGTLSVWWKEGVSPNNGSNMAVKGDVGVARFLMTSWGDANNHAAILINSGNTIDLFQYNTGYSSQLKVNALIRDVTAWQNLVFAWDTTQGTAANRNKIYINGKEQTYSVQTNYDEDDAVSWNAADYALRVGQRNSNGWFDGYMAEVVLIDGTAYGPTSFGEFDEDSPTIWKPIDVSGLTFGNNGFYLDFEDSSNLGNDANGGTDLAEENIAAVDQATDTPTNNFCTMNPLYNATSSEFAFTQGNCELTQNDSNWRTASGTIGLTSGKWYFEAKGGQGTNGYTHLGWASTSWLTEKGVGSMLEPTTTHNGPAVTYYGYNGNNYYSTSSSTGSNASYGDTWDNGDTISCYLDLDNNKAYWAKDGTVQNSGTGYSIESGFTWLPIVGGFDMDAGGESVKVNFGGCPATTISSGNADTNSYGNFEFDPSAGTFDGSSKNFLAICTKNLGSDGG